MILFRIIATVGYGFSVAAPNALSAPATLSASSVPDLRMYRSFSTRRSARSTIRSGAKQIELHAALGEDAERFTDDRVDPVENHADSHSGSLTKTFSEWTDSCRHGPGRSQPHAGSEDRRNLGCDRGSGRTPIVTTTSGASAPTSGEDQITRPDVVNAGTVLNRLPRARSARGIRGGTPAAPCQYSSDPLFNSRPERMADSIAMRGPGALRF